jgi:hypothetical protein
MLSTKFSTNAKPEKWLIFKYSNQKDIHPEFAKRLAALAKYMDRPIEIISGRRDSMEQARLYRLSGGKQDSNGNWYGGNGSAARPGNSKHEYGVAVDTSSLWLKALEKDESTKQQKILRKFGLFKPLTKGNGCSVREDWHIQPIETDGIYDRTKMARFLDDYKGKGFFAKLLAKLKK